MNRNPEVIKYTGDPPFSSLEEAKQFIGNYKDYKKNGYGRWAVELKSTNRFIGWCGLKLNELEKVDIGFRFFQKYWGNGYATEPGTACPKYGFEALDLNEIIAKAHPENIRSMKIVIRLRLKAYEQEYSNTTKWMYFKISKYGFHASNKIAASFKK